MPTKEFAFLPNLNFPAKSVFTSPQELAYTSAEKRWAALGFFVIILIKPPTASEPYNVDAGPLTISTLSISQQKKLQEHHQKELCQPQHT